MALKEEPLVSVVFVNYNGKEQLKGALQSIYKQTYTNQEVFVVDNNSTDGSQELIKTFKNNNQKITLIQNKENLGYVGINAVIPHLKGKYVLFLNNDLEMKETAVKALVAALEEDDLIALSVPKLINYYDRKIDSAGTWVSKSFYSGHYRSEATEKGNKTIPYMGIGLIRKSVVDKFGYLFDPDYFIYAEDLDLGLRIRLINMSTLYVSKAECYHMHSTTMKEVPNSKKTFLMERNLLTTFYKIPSISRLFLFFPYVYGIRILTILKDVFTLRFSVALARIKAIVFVFYSLPTIFKKRKQVQNLREAKDSYIFSIFTEKYIFSKKKVTI